MRQPGTIERAFGGAGAPGLGSMFLSTLAGAFIGSAIGNALFDQSAGSEGDAASEAEGSADAGDAGGDFAEGDLGGGDFGGDFGGGDFGGGDFGV
jgi:hypothetical protein